MVLASIERDYPYHLIHRLDGDDDLRLPRELWPAFHGAFDWHSSVHGHWCLVRLLRRHPHDDFAGRARARLAAALSPARLDGERAYLSAPGREGFERPYGLAWLLQLCAELREWDDPAGRQWGSALRQLEALAAERLRRWLPKLSWPNRSGEHGQSEIGRAHV